MKPVKRSTALYALIAISVIAALYGYHKQQNNLAREALYARFEKTASERVEKVKALNEAISEGRASFSLDKFSSVQSLQRELDRVFPYGTTVSEIDAIFVDRLGAFRTDNLIKQLYTGLLGGGSSSADNYIYYYKPSEPAGEHGWEDTSSGWVVRINHGSIPRSEDSKVDMMFGGGGKGLKQIHALATPQEQAEEEFGAKPVSFVKELLQYKIDTTPVETFDENEWSILVAEHQNSPCKQDLTYKCLTQQAIALLDISTLSQKSRYISPLARLAINRGDKDTASFLLKTWPTNEDIITHEESIPRLRKAPPSAIERRILALHSQKLLLLFLIGEYEEAEAILSQLQDEQKTGNDYKVISSLVNWGELDKALEISKMTLEWERQKPDPNENSSAIMHCENYQGTRPEAMGQLALAYIEKAELDKAYEVSQMVRRYWEGGAFGQKSFCYTNAAKRGYLSAMQALLKSYSEKGDKEKAREIFNEIRLLLQNQTEEIRRHTKWAFEQTARTAAKSGIIEDIEELAAFVEGRSTGMDYPEVYNSITNDPVPLIYALAGNYCTAIARIEGQSYTKNDKPEGPLDKIFDLKETPDDEIRLTTYLKIADALADLKDKEGTLLFLEKATPYFGIRNPKYDVAVDNLSDYITKANILLKIEEKPKSREVLNELISLFNETTEKDYRGGAITKSFYGKFAYLYAHHNDVVALQEWSDRLPSFYTGSYYARIAALLIKEERWGELDIYMPEMARVLSTDAQPIQNWYSFFHALIDAGEFDRYLKFLNTLSDGTDADRLRQDTRLQRIGEKIKPQTPDTRPQVQMMQSLIVSKLSSDKVPQQVIDVLWPRYIKNCRMWDHNLPRSEHRTRILPNAKETMAGCYITMIYSVADFERFTR
ncbi:MAG TPA: hypothetical protein EYG18_08600 [Micavibrio sp.]|nr:hypothetical protein [Micavibrio sp.]HIL29314.1 hypothetical protein [Micavibrio sp.]